MFIKLTSNVDGAPYLFPKASIAVAVNEGVTIIIPINGPDALEFGVSETFEEVEAMLTATPQYMEVISTIDSYVPAEVANGD